MKPAPGEWIWSYLRIGASAFGGGVAALPVFVAELSDRRRWLTPSEVAEAFAIAQSIPGVIIVNFAVFSALRISGRRAAVLAAVTVAMPAFLIILALATVAAGHWEHRWVAGALSGLRPAVVALVAAAALRLARPGLRSPLFLAAAGLSAAVMLAGWTGPVPLILAGAGVGLGWHVIARRRKVRT